MEGGVRKRGRLKRSLGRREGEEELVPKNLPGKTSLSCHFPRQAFVFSSLFPLLPSVVFSLFLCQFAMHTLPFSRRKTGRRKQRGKKRGNAENVNCKRPIFQFSFFSSEAIKIPSSFSSSSSSFSSSFFFFFGDRGAI